MFRTVNILDLFGATWLILGVLIEGVWGGLLMILSGVFFYISAWGSWRSDETEMSAPTSAPAPSEETVGDAVAYLHTRSVNGGPTHRWLTFHRAWPFDDVPGATGSTSTAELVYRTTPVVTDEMIEIVGSALYRHWNDVNHDCRTKYGERVRAALIKALGAQA